MTQAVHLPLSLSSFLPSFLPSFLTYTNQSVPQEPRDVIEVMAQQTGALFDALVRDERLLRCVRTWLNPAHHSSQNVGAQFAHVLLTYLADEKLAVLEQPASKVRGSALGPWQGLIIHDRGLHGQLKHTPAAAHCQQGCAEHAQCMANKKRSILEHPFSKVQGHYFWGLNLTGQTAASTSQQATDGGAAQTPKQPAASRSKPGSWAVQQRHSQDASQPLSAWPQSPPLLLRRRQASAQAGGPAAGGARQAPHAGGLCRDSQCTQASMRGAGLWQPPIPRHCSFTWLPPAQEAATVLRLADLLLEVLAKRPALEGVFVPVMPRLSSRLLRLTTHAQVGPLAGVRGQGPGFRVRWLSAAPHRTCPVGAAGSRVSRAGPCPASAAACCTRPRTPRCGLSGLEGGPQGVGDLSVRSWFA